MIRRAAEGSAEESGEGTGEGTGEGSGEVARWSSHRVMQWLKQIDLAEYAPNLRGAGQFAFRPLDPLNFSSGTNAELALFKF